MCVRETTTCQGCSCKRVSVDFCHDYVKHVASRLPALRMTDLNPGKVILPEHPEVVSGAGSEVKTGEIQIPHSCVSFIQNLWVCNKNLNPGDWVWYQWGFQRENGTWIRYNHVETISEGSVSLAKDDLAARFKKSKAPAKGKDAEDFKIDEQIFEGLKLYVAPAAPPCWLGGLFGKS